MKRRLSSILVPVFKIIPIFLFVDVLYWVIQDFRNIVEPGLLFLFAFTIIWFLATVRWKWVHLYGGRLIVSNFLKTIEIPLSEVESVEASSFWSWNPRRITIDLKNETPFGQTIVYIPRGLGFIPEPSADELRRMVAASMKKR